MKLSSVGRVARNSIALTCALLIKRVTNFVLYILMARHLGVVVFGQFSLVYAFFIIFQVPAMFGLANLIVREVAKNKPDFDKYLINGHFITFLASLFSIGVWVLFVHLLGYSSEVIKATYLLGWALIPFAMSKVCEAIFQAFERMQFIVYAFALANLAKIGLVWLLLSRGFGMLQILGLLVAVQLAIFLIEWYFLLRHFPPISWAIDLSFCRKLAKTSITFLGIGVFTVVFLRLNIIVLSKLGGEVEVGLYNAAFQLCYVFMLISMSLTQAVFPVLSRTYTANLARFKQYSERSIEFLISIALPLAVGFLFLAEHILLVYRTEFVAAAPVMRILGWMLVPLSFNRILGGVLLASGRQKANLAITIVNTVSLLFLSIALTTHFGLIGAGTAFLVSYIISWALHYSYVVRTVFPISISRVMWKPALASLVLAAFLLLLGKSQGLQVLIPSAIVLYGAVLLGLNFRFGGPLKSRSLGWLVGKSGSGIPGSDA